MRHKVPPQKPKRRYRKQSSAVANNVFNAIYELLETGRFRPDEFISENLLIKELRQRGLTVSRMPIRRALTRLESAKLLQILPQKGTRVRRPDNEEVRQLWDRLVAMEEFVAVSLARQWRFDPTPLADIQAQLKSLSGNKNQFDLPTVEVEHQFLALDRQFHSCLAELAGLPGLAEELATLHLRLSFAGARQFFRSYHKMQDVIRDHDNIIRALRPLPEEPCKLGEQWTRPDINLVRLATRMHLRNYATDVLRIESQVTEGGFSETDPQNIVFDLPKVRHLEAFESKAPLECLLAVRLALELTAVRELAARPGTDLGRLYEINRAIGAFESPNTRPEERLEEEIEARILNLDIGFHCELCFLSGMLFAEEAVIYIWRQYWKKAYQQLTYRRLREIVEEHAAMIDTLDRSRGTPEDVDVAVNAALTHFTRAVQRNLTPPLTALAREANSVEPLSTDLAAFVHQLGQFAKLKGLHE